MEVGISKNLVQNSDPRSATVSFMIVNAVLMILRLLVYDLRFRREDLLLYHYIAEEAAGQHSEISASRPSIRCSRRALGHTWPDTV